MEEEDTLLSSFTPKAKLFKKKYFFKKKEDFSKVLWYSIINIFLSFFNKYNFNFRKRNSF